MKFIPRFSAAHCASCTAVLLASCLLFVFSQAAWGQERVPASQPTSQPSQPAGTSVTPPTAEPALSKAEQITRLQRSLEENQKRIAELRRELESPDGEYQQAEAAFKKIDERYVAEKGDLAAAEESQELNEIAMAEVRLLDTERSWKLARAQFDLAIEKRNTQQEQLTAFEANQQQNQQLLDQLTGTPKAEAEPAAATPAPAMSTATAGAPTGTGGDATRAPVAGLPTAGLIPGIPGLPGTSASDAPVEIFVRPTRPPSPELIEAEQHAQLKQLAAETAEKKAQDAAERRANLERSLDLELRLMQAARKKSDLANESRRVAEQEYKRKVRNGTNDELREIAARVDASEAQFNDARNEVRMRTDRMNELNAERAKLHAEELAAASHAHQSQQELNEAQAIVGELKNPFALRNIWQWLMDPGLKVLTIVVVLFLLRLIIQTVTRRVVSRKVNVDAQGNLDDSADRVKTLAGVFQNAASLAIIVGGLLMIFEQVGVAVGPLMGGAAVLGLAIAFGAQNLIRDYFYGFVILLENQYKLNDVVRIGTISGQVERITLRMTVLRDIEGSVHFIPNGKIDSVSNLTHGWSRAVFDIRVGYREDIDRVIKILLELAREMRYEAAYARLIIDEPEMLGVEALNESCVVVRFLLKTRPLKQWPVKRELLRRIKARFDELNIEIPYPQRIVYYRDDHGAEYLHDDAATSPIDSSGRKKTA